MKHWIHLEFGSKRRSAQLILVRVDRRHDLLVPSKNSNGPIPQVADCTAGRTSKVQALLVSNLRSDGRVVAMSGIGISGTFRMSASAACGLSGYRLAMRAYGLALRALVRLTWLARRANQPLRCPVPPAKIFRWCRRANQGHWFARPFPQRGVGQRHQRGRGCGGR
jgi:hypothetical protein